MWDPVRRQLYWTNATGQAIYRYDRRREEVGLLTEQVQAAGIALHEDGGLILGGGPGFLYWNGDEAIRVIADTCDGRPVTQINDIIADPAGRIFGGQEAYREDEPYDPGYLFRVEPDGSINPQISELFIQKNLCEALYHLRYTNTVRTLWVDAVCINQKDDQERHEGGLVPDPPVTPRGPRPDRAGDEDADPEDERQVDRDVRAQVPDRSAGAQVLDGEHAAGHEPAQRGDRHRDVDVEDLLDEALVGVVGRVEEHEREGARERHDGGG